MRLVAAYADAPPLEDAQKDLVKNRPQCEKGPVLVATGDSITAAHFQSENSVVRPCGNTTSDQKRNLPGNDGNMSYVGRYFDANDKIAEYYNFARTGFSTWETIYANKFRLDGCRNMWNRDSTPLALAKAVVVKAKAENRPAYFVTTGGINDTNWTEVLEATLICRALEIMRDEPNEFNWHAYGGGGGKESVVPHGGRCTATHTWGWGAVQRVYIPRFHWDFTSTSMRAQQIVHEMLGAGADRVVWMLYYDLTPAIIKIGHVVAYDLAQSFGGSRFFDITRLGDGVLSIVEPEWVEFARDVQYRLNAAITGRLPLGLNHDQWARVRIVKPYLSTADIQHTARGGSPHPNEEGHKKMAELVRNAIDVAPASGTGIALKANANNLYVTPWRGGDDPLVASSHVTGAAQAFHIVDTGRKTAGNRRIVGLLSLANYNYVTSRITQAGGNGVLVAGAAKLQAWEEFELLEPAGGVKPGAVISLRALNNNKWVTANVGPLTSSRPDAEPAAWERLTVAPAPSGYVLKARDVNRYITAASWAPAPLKATSVTAGPWETYYLVELGNLGEPNRRFVALVSQANSLYVTAVDGGNQPLAANVGSRPTMWGQPLENLWEVFEIAPYTRDNLGGYALRAMANNRWVTVNPALGNQLHAGRLASPPDLWERIDLIPFNPPPP
jgi:hypothetical protein